MSLLDQPIAGSNLPEYTVAELSAQLKRSVEEEFGHVRVRGEISQPKLHTSGHLYFTLKDENANLAGVCWKGQVGRLKVKPVEGMEVVVEGRLTTYPGQSKYQIVAEQMALAGVGALMKMLEDRKKKLAAEGLFDEARKKPLPKMPKVIGVITSPTGAVIKDILHRVAERFPVHVLVWPVNVQGEGAAVQIANAIAGFNALLDSARAVVPSPDGTERMANKIPVPDVLIVARGGGSLEDMLPFYEEIVVRAAANSRIPLISAVGHETDTTMIDFASDRRAPTPTAAAEMAVPVRLDLLAMLRETGMRLDGAARRCVEKQKLQLERAAGKLTHPRVLMETLAQRLDDRAERLATAVTNMLSRQQQRLQRLAAGLNILPLKQNVQHGKQKLESLIGRMNKAVQIQFEKKTQRLVATGQLLESLSYHSILKRGFVLVRDAQGHTIMRAADVRPASELTLTFADGDKKVKA
ncbi:MAG: exodeoxyribonuclease VII large subunit [Alphaproteobacteria bacterium]|nr:exodeoxyribonuclease VII large subunit [Alphaproteobacteria bacterium]